jgi:hypothetical protein
VSAEDIVLAACAISAADVEDIAAGGCACGVMGVVCALKAINPSPPEEDVAAEGDSVAVMVDVDNVVGGEQPLSRSSRSLFAT